MAPRKFGKGTVQTRRSQLSSMKPLLSILAGAAVLTACSHTSTTVPKPAPKVTSSSSVTTSAPAPVRCTKPAPTTAQGFSAMFARSAGESVGSG